MLKEKEQKDKNVEILGKYLGQMFEEFFSNSIWYEKSFNRNRDEVEKFLETITVVKCSGYDDNFRHHCLLRLDLYKIPEYNKAYKKIIKNIKKEKRFCIFDANFFFTETLGGLVSWDLDVTTYLIQHLIKNSK